MYFNSNTSQQGRRGEIMKKTIVLCSVLILFSACATVSPEQQPAPAPVTTTTGTANAPAPTTTGTENVPAPAPSLTIVRMVISAGVKDRTPLDMGTTFPASQEKVSCFIEFKDVKKETTINVVWMYGQKEMDKIPLTIKPSPRYRTWATKTIYGMKGKWKVDVLDEKGDLIKSIEFTVQ
jgi:hypothetical protein